MKKQSFLAQSTRAVMEKSCHYVSSEKTNIKETFDRIRAEMAQEAEQRSRPVARIYSGFRAFKA
jgi:hypothetical protein